MRIVPLSKLWQSGLKSKQKSLYEETKDILCRNVLVTASDKVINVWDLVSLQSIGTLRGHKDEIRALHVSNDMLISAGKGGVANGSVLTWDLRSLK